MCDQLNTHSYDGKLNIDQLPDLILLNKLSLEEKKNRGFQLIDVAKGLVTNTLVTNTLVTICQTSDITTYYTMNIIALSFLENIVASMGTPSNIDNTNGLVADDLICICWVYRYNIEFMRLLEMQLIDMATGFCPQGRTHRLFQTLLAFTDT